MKTKLRLIGSLTAGLILVGGLSACGSDDADGGTTATTKAEGTVTTKAEGTATTAKAAETTTTKK